MRAKYDSQIGIKRKRVRIIEGEGLKGAVVA